MCDARLWNECRFHVRISKKLFGRARRNRRLLWLRFSRVGLRFSLFDWSLFFIHGRNTSTRGFGAFGEMTATLALNVATFSPLSVSMTLITDAFEATSLPISKRALAFRREMAFARASPGLKRTGSTFHASSQTWM